MWKIPFSGKSNRFHDSDTMFSEIVKNFISLFVCRFLLNRELSRNISFCVEEIGPHRIASHPQTIQKNFPIQPQTTGDPHSTIRKQQGTKHDTKNPRKREENANKNLTKIRSKCANKSNTINQLMAIAIQEYVALWDFYCVHCLMPFEAITRRCSIVFVVTGKENCNERRRRRRRRWKRRRKKAILLLWLYANGQCGPNNDRSPIRAWSNHKCLRIHLFFVSAILNNSSESKLYIIFFLILLLYWLFVVSVWLMFLLLLLLSAVFDVFWYIGLREP